MSQENSYEHFLLELQQHADSSERLANLLPTTGQTFDIDLNTRTVNTPEFLSVQYDHNAEIIYFKCARYFDNMDLVNTVCIVEYLNAEHLKDPDNPKSAKVRDSGLFWVPYYDINHYDESIDEEGNKIVTPMIYIPWAIGGLATKYPGKITFAVRFYRLTEDGQKYLYNLSTKPTNGQILHGMDLIDRDELEEFFIEPDIVAQIYADLSHSIEALNGDITNATTYWITL